MNVTEIVQTKKSEKAHRYVVMQITGNRQKRREHNEQDQD